MDQAVTYNNAGVACWHRGLPQIAWDLFKGALEVKLQAERVERLQQQCIPACNVYVARAEAHLRNLHNFLASECKFCALIIPEATPDEHGQSQEQSPNALSSSSGSGDGMAAADECSCESTALELSTDPLFYSPHLYDRPFAIERPPAHVKPSPDDDTTTTAFARKASATIIYNLGLLDQIYHRDATAPSRQALVLYELSTSLLQPHDDQYLLRMALLNNMGVWCFEAGDLGAAQQCMTHLQRQLRDSDVKRKHDNEAVLYRKLRANIDYLLNPPCTVSPAA